MAAEALLAFRCYEPSEDERGLDPHRELATVGALLCNEALCHLRAISKSEIHALMLGGGTDVSG